jgi:hypothetical protein
LGEIEELPMATSVIGEQTDLNYVELDTTPYLGVIRLLAALCTVGIIVGGAFPQLQMALLGGFVPVTPAVFKVGLVIILLAVFGLRGTAFVYSKVLRDAFLLMGVIFVSTMSVLITSGYSGLNADELPVLLHAAAGMFFHGHPVTSDSQDLRNTLSSDVFDLPGLQYGPIPYGHEGTSRHERGREF